MPTASLTSPSSAMIERTRRSAPMRMRIPFDVSHSPPGCSAMMGAGMDTPSFCTPAFGAGATGRLPPRQHAPRRLPRPADSGFAADAQPETVCRPLPPSKPREGGGAANAAAPAQPAAGVGVGWRLRAMPREGHGTRLRTEWVGCRAWASGDGAAAGRSSARDGRRLRRRPCRRRPAPLVGPVQWPSALQGLPQQRAWRTGPQAQLAQWHRCSPR